jgi:hypothetical protein
MTTRCCCSIAISFLTLASTGSARAEEKVPGAISVGAKVGVLLPQITTELTTTWGTELEGSFRVFGHISVFGTFGYTQPKVSRSTIADPRVGGSYSGAQTQRELTLGAGAIYRMSPAEALWNVYGGAGIRAYFLQTLTDGESMNNEFGENKEQSTKIGGVLFLGGERRLGPGSLLAELQFGASDLGHTITGDVTTGALLVAVGYRLFF